MVDTSDKLYLNCTNIAILVDKATGFESFQHYFSTSPKISHRFRVYTQLIQLIEDLARTTVSGQPTPHTTRLMHSL